MPSSPTDCPPRSCSACRARSSPTSTGLAVGIREQAPWDDDVVLRGGSFFCTLSRLAVESVLHFADARPDVAAHLGGSIAPDEVYLQTALGWATKHRPLAKDLQIDTASLGLGVQALIDGAIIGDYRLGGKAIDLLLVLVLAGLVAWLADRRWRPLTGVCWVLVAWFLPGRVRRWRSADKRLTTRGLLVCRPGGHTTRPRGNGLRRAHLIDA